MTIIVDIKELPRHKIMIIIVVIKVLPVINQDHYRGHQNTTRHKS